mmetsp:Transcript_61316/g.138794  ORF Transcript_61316/g.138794 Transcript_61316/m.138794 type:complete len:283 (-) Transcript_61316:151-999(-)
MVPPPRLPPPPRRCRWRAGSTRTRRPTSWAPSTRWTRRGTSPWPGAAGRATPPPSRSPDKRSRRSCPPGPRAGPLVGSKGAPSWGFGGAATPKWTSALTPAPAPRASSAPGVRWPPSRDSGAAPTRRPPTPRGPPRSRPRSRGARWASAASTPSPRASSPSGVPSPTPERYLDGAFRPRTTFGFLAAPRRPCRACGRRKRVAGAPRTPPRWRRFAWCWSGPPSSPFGGIWTWPTTRAATRTCSGSGPGSSRGSWTTGGPRCASTRFSPRSISSRISCSLEPA